jgi:hypothetical protein
LTSTQKAAPNIHDQLVCRVPTVVPNPSHEIVNQATLRRFLFIIVLTFVLVASPHLLTAAPTRRLIILLSAKRGRIEARLLGIVEHLSNGFTKLGLVLTWLDIRRVIGRRYRETTTAPTAAYDEQDGLICNVFAI